MIPVAWLASFGGAYLVWSALNNRNPLSALRSALTGDPTVAPLTGGTTAAGAVGGDVAGGTPSTSTTTSTSTAPTVVAIGYNGHRLAPAAAAAYKAASIRFGRPIPVTDSYRSYAQQADCYDRKPDLCAKPSMTAPHVRGIAIDVDGGKTGGYENPALIAALTSTGWKRNGKRLADGKPEPWHWEYGS